MDLRRRLNTLRELGPGPTILGPALYNSTLERPTGLRKATTRLNQALFEQGTTPPWVWSQERCQRYWSTRTSDGVDNRPADYVAKNPAIVDLMHKFWSPEVSPSSAVMELGCNAGANLERLRQLGYTDLTGLEINRTAIQELHEAFPALAGEASLIVGSLEHVLPTLKTDGVDVIDLFLTYEAVAQTAAACRGRLAGRIWLARERGSRSGGGGGHLGCFGRGRCPPEP